MMKNSKFEENNKLKKSRRLNQFKKVNPTKKKLPKKKKIPHPNKQLTARYKVKILKASREKNYVIQRARNKIIIIGLFPESMEAR